MDSIPDSAVCNEAVKLAAAHKFTSLKGFVNGVLREILKDAQKENVDEYVFLGDLVNDFPFGNETLEIVKNISKDVLKGNFSSLINKSSKRAISK